MKRLQFIIYSIFFLSACTPVESSKTAYENLSITQQNVVDTVLDEFKRHHLYFLPEYSEVLELTAATARADSETGEGVANHDPQHDHGSSQDTSYQDEHLDIKIAQATPDAGGKYHTPTIQLTPDRVYTYKALYTVNIADTQISVNVTEAVENVPERVTGTPDPEFLQDLAQRLNGRVEANGRIILP